MDKELIFYEQIKESLETQIAYMERIQEDMNHIVSMGNNIGKNSLNCEILLTYTIFNKSDTFGTEYYKLQKLKRFKATVEQKISKIKYLLSVGQLNTL